MRTLLTIILTCVAAVASGQVYRGGQILRIKDSDVYWAAVKTSYFREYVARQEEDCWCRAACVQMVLSYQGVRVDQEALVKRAKGHWVLRQG